LRITTTVPPIGCLLLYIRSSRQIDALFILIDEECAGKKFEGHAFDKEKRSCVKKFAPARLPWLF
jgi:hypothetical protein